LKGKDALLGFLLDGFPVYGTIENGVTVTNSNLDVYHGHMQRRIIQTVFIIIISLPKLLI
jgi:hypothetical protein